MGVYIKGMDMPKSCEDCPCAYFTEGAYSDECQVTHKHITDEKPTDCPLIEIDLERDIPTVWYNRQTGLYEPKGTKQEIYERLYKLKNGERRADE